nr:low molecular weight phosphotyrosine protein phosphatase [Quercus suber]
MCFDAHGALVIHPLLAQFFAVLTAISPPFSPLADSPAEGKVAGCFRSCRIAPHDLRPGSQRSTKVRTATARIDALGCASQMTKHSKIASEIIIRHISQQPTDLRTVSASPVRAPVSLNSLHTRPSLGPDTMSDPVRVSILFVCLGNICRSPMAEAVFQHLSAGHPLIANIDSCGTGAYHAGDDPDPRTMSTLHQNGITSYTHAARKVLVPEDFEEFDYILGMDGSNVADLRRMARRAENGKGEVKAKVMLFGEFGGKGKEEVGDPYYGARDGFTIAFEQVQRFSRGLLKHLEEEEQKKARI